MSQRDVFLQGVLQQCLCPDEITAKMLFQAQKGYEHRVIYDLITCQTFLDTIRSDVPVKLVNVGFNTFVEEKYVSEEGMWKAQCQYCNIVFNVCISRVYVFSAQEEQWYCDGCAAPALRERLVLQK